MAAYRKLNHGSIRQVQSAYPNLALPRSITINIHSPLPRAESPADPVNCFGLSSASYSGRTFLIRMFDLASLKCSRIFVAVNDRLYY